MKFLLQYIDQLVMGATVLASAWYCRRAYVTFRPPMRPGALFAVILGPMLVALSMGAHLVEILFHALERIEQDTFHFDFHFYALLQMGVVFLGISSYMLGQVWLLCRGRSRAGRQIWWAALLLSGLSAPTVVFTPIGLLPTLACVVSVVGLRLVYKPIEELQPVA
ncbi:hypothetical protein [Hymenobacter sp. BT730]|uniref:hypothetical protein n=1 Tax=Hymenobacter sp. BT730 TaxID=3063332 RepID=UPI0026DF5506|nr:hypothetical protein [Hymenobacter sp. BT730]